VRGAEPDAKSRYARISSNSIASKKELGLNRNPTGIVQQCQATVVNFVGSLVADVTVGADRVIV
jgi:hypothetical protein